MNYEKIWQKTLSGDEKIEYEFSVGDGYVKFGLFVWGIISFLLLFAAGLGIFIFLIVLFYYAFYLKAANAYAFTNKRVLIHRGWLSTHLTSVDYSKITNINIQEPFFNRILTRTGNIAIITAGTTTDQIVLRNINAPYEIKKKLDLLKDK
ncbi:PH domain-containing protein [Patescibacteria group bacterium]|nr:PH domain-containing protein [Patescibacteria group bacterium]